MPKIVIIYDSKTGNTEKMAQAVAEGARAVGGVEVELHKVGARFPLSILNEVDAIVFGSPSEYSNATRDMRGLIESATELKTARKLKLRGKVGGVFSSYAWDGGWVTDRLNATMKTLEVRVLPPMVSAVDRMGAGGAHIDEDSLQKCRQLGKNIAEKIA